MMRKLLCLVLALMLLCGSALAEAYQATITFSSNTAQLTELLTQAGMTGNRELLAQGLEELLAKLRLELFIQNEAFQGGIYLADESLIDLTSFVDDEGLLHMVSNLLPNHYLAYQLTEEEKAQTAQAQRVMNTTDWQDVLKELTALAQAWWDKLPCQESAGTFMGDAYAGGTRCISTSFDDAGIAQLVDTLSAALQQHGVDDGFLAEVLYQKDFWDAVTAANQQAAQDNRYRYTVRQVYGQDDALAGLSLIVQDGETQVMTASLGAKADGWKLVLAWGKDERNYYLCLESYSEADSTEWTALLYQDPQRLGFPLVETLPSYLLWVAGGELTQREHAAWRMDMEAIDLYTDDPLLKDFYMRLDLSQTDTSVTLETLLYLPNGEDGAAEEPVLGVQMKLQQTEERTWLVEDKQRLDMEAPDTLGAEAQTVMEQEIQQSLDVLLVQLFKTLPAQLITFLMQNFTD